MMISHKTNLELKYYLSQDIMMHYMNDLVRANIINKISDNLNVNKIMKLIYL